jgi:predicted phosphoribosyltransferase
VIVAVPVAGVLGAPLDVVIPRKLGAPANPELAIGAVAPGVRVLDRGILRRLAVSPDYLESEIERAEDEIRRRTDAYRGGRPAVDVSGRAAIVVDDGVATGATAVASLRWARSRGPDRVLFAAPVGPAEAAARLGDECDELILLETPRSFYAVGEWYDRFDQVTDDEVTAALAPGS